jgi:hypothetical protein
MPPFDSSGDRVLFPRVFLLLSSVVPVFAVHARDVEAKLKLAAAGQALGKALAMHDQAALEKLWLPQMIDRQRS